MAASCCSFGNAYDDVKLAKNIKFHLGLSGHTSFDMLAEESRDSIGDRLKLILGMVASGALLSLMSNILSESDIKKLAAMRGIFANGSDVDSSRESILTIEEQLEVMFKTEGDDSSGETASSDPKEVPAAKPQDIIVPTNPSEVDKSVEASDNTEDQDLMILDVKGEYEYEDASSDGDYSDSNFEEFRQFPTEP